MLSRSRDREKGFGRRLWIRYSASDIDLLPVVVSGENLSHGQSFKCHELTSRWAGKKQHKFVADKHE